MRFESSGHGPCAQRILPNLDRQCGGIKSRQAFRGFDLQKKKKNQNRRTPVKRLAGFQVPDDALLAAKSGLLLAKRWGSTQSWVLSARPHFTHWSIAHFPIFDPTKESKDTLTENWAVGFASTAFSPPLHLPPNTDDARSADLPTLLFEQAIDPCQIQKPKKSRTSLEYRF